MKARACSAPGPSGIPYKNVQNCLEDFELYGSVALFQIAGMQQRGVICQKRSTQRT